MRSLPPPGTVLKPIPEGGLKVGHVGSTWWGKRWLAALERFSAEFGHRLERGRDYAQTGRVHDLRLEGPTVVAAVTGSRPEDYEVRMSLDRIDDAVWERVIEAMASRAAFIAALLAGEMPGEIDQAFAQAGATLFPASEEDLWTSCTCPDWANPCKHVAACHYVLADLIDHDPFVLFDLRGRSRDGVLGALRRARGVEPVAHAATEVPSVAVEGPSAQGYESPGAPLRLKIRIQAPTAPAAILRQLGPPPSWAVPVPVEVVLGPVYESAGQLARSIAFAVDEEALAAAKAEASAALSPPPKIRARKSPSLPATVTAPVVRAPVVIRRKKVEAPAAPVEPHRGKRRRH
jgi:uncharacterized Zn finger protein